MSSNIVIIEWEIINEAGLPMGFMLDEYDLNSKSEKKRMNRDLTEFSRTWKQEEIKKYDVTKELGKPIYSWIGKIERHNTKVNYIMTGSELSKNLDDPTEVWGDNGLCKWYKPNTKILHRTGDKPAVVYAHGRQEWYIDGKLHRTGDQPALIYSEDKMEWYKDGVRHRDNNEPATITKGVLEIWWQHGKLHRIGGPAVKWSNGNQMYYQYNKLQSPPDGGPAVITPGIKKEWRSDGLLHRLDGPAVIHQDGRQEYWLNNKKYTKEVYDVEILEFKF